MPASVRRGRIRALLAWWDAGHRDLPWRRTRDPYAIWVSEVMLQQTRVEVARGYWERFLARFPTVAALARAPLDDVLAAWSGLGYYRRARHLHEAARSVAARPLPELPRDPAGLLGLPGFGSYTAGALASIAFDVAVPAVDGNVLRVLSRWLALRSDPRAAPGRRVVEAEARALVEASDRPGDWNQALMELGAMVCTPSSPRCEGCPVARSCGARALGLVGSIPALRSRRPSVRVRQAAALVRRGGDYLFVRRPEAGTLAGLWELPTIEIEEGAESGTRLARYVRDRTGLAVTVGASVARVRHTITFHRIEIEAREAATRRGTARPPASWLSPEEARRAGLTAATRKLLDASTRTERFSAPRTPSP